MPTCASRSRWIPAEARARLARHAMEVIQGGLDEEAPSDAQADQVNQLIRLLDQADVSETDVALPARILRGITRRSPLGDPVPLPPAPATPFSQSDLLVNAEGQPNVGSELRAELATADSVDLICAFIIWSGVRHVREALEASEGARRTHPRDHHDLYGGDGEARGRRTACAWSRDQGRARCSHHEAARQGVAARARFRPQHGVCGLLEPLAHGAVRWTGVERPSVIDRRRATSSTGCG